MTRSPLLSTFASALAFTGVAAAQAQATDADFEFGCAKADKFTGEVSVSKIDGKTVVAHFQSGALAEKTQLEAMIGIYDQIARQSASAADVRGRKQVGYAVCQKQEDDAALTAINTYEAGLN